MERDGLDELIDAENKSQIGQIDFDDDDARSSVDIRDFERRLKSNRSKRKLPGDLSSSDDDDFLDSASQYSHSSQHSRMSSTSSQAAKAAVNSQAILQSKNSIMSKVQKIKEQSSQSSSIRSASSTMSATSGGGVAGTTQNKNMKSNDDPVEAILKGPNPDQKVKELLTKYHQLLKSYEREKSLRQKYEQESGSSTTMSKTKMDDTSFSSTGSYQSSKMPKGTSVLSAINQNEENLTLKSDLQKLQKELAKKENMLNQLISEKAMGGGSNNSGLKGLEESKAKRCENEMKVLKKERDEFFASRFDKIYFQKNGELVKDLSNQNAKMRAKIEELESIMKNR